MCFGYDSKIYLVPFSAMRTLSILTYSFHDYSYQRQTLGAVDIHALNLLVCLELMGVFFSFCFCVCFCVCLFFN